MRQVVLAALALTLPVVASGCGSARERSDGRACTGLDVRVMERAVAPPANVSAVVRITDCAGEPLMKRLDTGAFELTEDGKPLSQQEASRLIYPSARARAQRTLLALDLSGSIVRSGLREPMIGGAKALALTLATASTDEAPHEVAIFGFDGRPDLVPFTFFTKDRNALTEALASAQRSPLVDDSTNLNGAVVSALKVLDGAVAADARNPGQIARGSLVVFTDGQDLAGRVSDEELRRALDATPHSTFAVGVGPAIDRDNLTTIGKTASEVASGPDQVLAAFEKIGRELKALSETDYVVSYCSPARAGTRRLSIQVSDGERSGEATIDFDAQGFGAGCTPESTAFR